MKELLILLLAAEQHYITDEYYSRNKNLELIENTDLEKNAINSLKSEGILRCDRYSSSEHEYNSKAYNDFVNNKITGVFKHGGVESEVTCDGVKIEILKLGDTTTLKVGIMGTDKDGKTLGMPLNKIEFK